MHVNFQILNDSLLNIQANYKSRKAVIKKQNLYQKLILISFNFQLFYLNPEKCKKKRVVNILLHGLKNQGNLTNSEISSYIFIVFGQIKGIYLKRVKIIGLFSEKFQIEDFLKPFFSLIKTPAHYINYPI